MKKKNDNSQKTQTQNERERLARLGNTSYQPQKKVPEPTLERYPVGWKRWFIRSLLSVIAFLGVLLVGIMVWNIRNFNEFSAEVFGSSSVLDMFPTQALTTDEAGRTNILILGTASDRPGHGGSDLTDTILLVSLDASDDGYMLSIPRDLYVSIPGYSQARINEVYARGERNDFREPGYANGGSGLMQKTIENTIGIQTHYHAVVSFQAVERIVDALDGVTVTIDSPDERGLYDPNFREFEGGPLRLKNGPQEIDGQTALRLSRARGSTGEAYGFPDSDFDRTRNQQEVLRAILAELDWRVVLDPRLNQRLFDAVASTTQTDIEINELLPLYRAISPSSLDQLKSHTLRDIDGQNLLTSYTSPSGAAVLIPNSGIDNFTDVRQALDTIHR